MTRIVEAIGWRFEAAGDMARTLVERRLRAALSPRTGRISTYVWRPRSDRSRAYNFGDELGALVVDGLLGQPLPVRHDFATRDPLLLSIGSLLQWARNGDVVWGAGFLGTREKPPRIDMLEVHAVRGPLSRGFVVHRIGLPCPEVFGDPALLLPRVMPLDVAADIELGLVPHHEDRDSAAQAEPLGIPVIAPVGAPQDVVPAIMRCRRVVSSSLHGIIVAEAYGVPAVWLQPAGSTQEETKFFDYYLGTDRHARPSRSLRAAIAADPPPLPSTHIADRLAASFPRSRLLSLSTPAAS